MCTYLLYFTRMISSRKEAIENVIIIIMFIAETYKDEINEHTKQHAIFKRIEIIAVFMLIKNVFFFFLECGWQIKAIHTRTCTCHSSLTVSVSHWLGCRCWKWDAFFRATESVTILFRLPLSSLCVVKGVISWGIPFSLIFQDKRALCCENKL